MDYYAWKAEAIEILSSDEEETSPIAAKEDCHRATKVTQDGDDDDECLAVASPSSKIAGDDLSWKPNNSQLCSEPIEQNKQCPSSPTATATPSTSLAKDAGNPVTGKHVSMKDDNDISSEENNLDIADKPRSIAGENLGGHGSQQKQKHKQPGQCGPEPKQSQKQHAPQPKRPQPLSLTKSPRLAGPPQVQAGRTHTFYPMSYQSLPLQPEVPPPPHATWKVVLLMDHREFGNSTTFLQEVGKKINKRFKGAYSEVEALPSADYYFVARLVSNDNRVLDERVLDLVIERKCVTDLAQCLILPSKDYRPLSFFEAQMYKVRRSCRAPRCVRL